MCMSMTEDGFVPERDDVATAAVMHAMQAAFMRLVEASPNWTSH